MTKRDRIDQWGERRELPVTTLCGSQILAGGQLTETFACCREHRRTCCFRTVNDRVPTSYRGVRHGKGILDCSLPLREQSGRISGLCETERTSYRCWRWPYLGTRRAGRDLRGRPGAKNRRHRVRQCRACATGARQPSISRSDGLALGRGQNGTSASSRAFDGRVKSSNGLLAVLYRPVAHIR